jgi:hypothetical protein
MRITVLSIFLFFSFATLRAQQNDTALVTNVINELTQFWSGYKSKIFVQNDSVGIRDVRKFLTEPAFIANQGAKNISGNILENKLRAQILRKDWGLKFTSGYLENFNPAFNDDDNLIYNRRVQAGVNWDVLSSGFVENRNKAKIEELENQILQSAFLPGNKTEDLTVKWNQVIYQFNLIKIKILEERLTLIEKQNKAAQKLFLSRYLTKEIYLENEKRLAEIKSMMRIYVDFNTQLKSMGLSLANEIDFPLIDLKYEVIFEDKSHSESALNDSLINLIRQKNIIQNKYINDINLGTFLRYNYYDLITADPASRAFMSTGINLSLPITFNKKLKEEYIEIKSLNEYENLLKEDETQKANILDDAYEFRYKLKQYIVFYQKKLLFNELLRKENARLTIDPVSFNPYKVISMQDDLLSIDLELTELKQNMYLKMLKIYSRKTNLTANNAFQSYILLDKIEYVNPIRRSIYAWSSAFENYDSSFITEYIKFHDLKAISISQGNLKKLFPKINSTIKSLVNAGIEIELLIGDNDFVNKNIENYFVEGGIDITNVSTIHVDYEPHTFADWKEKKADYILQYLKSLEKARQFCNEKHMKLIIDIPLHYDEKDVKDLISICDNVCFMAYENVKTTYITNKVQPYLTTPNKISIALRTNDFTSRSAMEEKFNELSGLTGINNYYLHDLTRCIVWDEKAVEKE